MDLNLAGRTALVTGGSSGLGLACSLALAAEGCAAVAIVGRSERRLGAVGQQIDALGARVLELPADLRLPDEADRVAQLAADAFGGVDILVSCAGGAPPGGLPTLSEADWTEGFRTKILAYQAMVSAVVPHMVGRAGGRIVLMSGSGSRQPTRFALAVGVFGAGVNALVRGLSEELAPRGIGVVAVCPGPTETARWPILRQVIADRLGVSAAAAEESVIRDIPMGRLATSAEIGDLVAFLASPRAAYITGVNVLIDGGAVKSI